MIYRVFIQTKHKQIVGALVAEYALQSNSDKIGAEPLQKDQSASRRMIHGFSRVTTCLQTAPGNRQFLPLRYAPSKHSHPYV